MELGSRRAFALVVLVGVAGTGIAVRLVNAAGYSLLGSAVWAIGYGTTVFVLWYGWVRPLDLTGQTSPAADRGEDAPPEPTDGDATTDGE
ncbi:MULTISPECIES: hypothetical protein [Salinibaculum]|uniref:hypothetical protein n=1 Tax=Salinibaculum TaxID=2732368 RepID=UPI0030CE7DD6